MNGGAGTRVLRGACPSKSQKAHSFCKQSYSHSPVQGSDSPSLGRRHEGRGRRGHLSPGTWIPPPLWSLLPLAVAKPSSHLLSSQHVFLPGLPISLLAAVNPCCSVNSHTGHMTILLHAPVASGLTCNPYSLPGLREPSVIWLLLHSLPSSGYPSWYGHTHLSFTP